MLGFEKRETRGARCEHARAKQRSHRARRRMSFEALDERTVLSAVSLVDVSDLVDGQCSDSPAAAPAADVEINQTPMGTDHTVYMSGMSYAFSVYDFGFSDPGNSPPNVFSAVRLASLPPVTAGSLTDRGSGVAVGQYIPVSDLMSGLFQFSSPGTNNPSYATFTFQVQDDGGSSHGGTDLDPTPNTMTMIFNSAPARFVRGLYQDVLDRAPDAPGYTHWLGQLDGGVSRRQVAISFWESAEHRGIQVDSYYQQFLHRSADPAGRQNWINRMVSGVTEETVMISFMSSGEFQSDNPTDDAFVTAVYNDVLARAPDAGGKNYYVSALTSGQLTRGDVIASFVNSRERHVKLVDAYYEEFLKRPADSYGEQYYTNQLDQHQIDDQGVALALLSSQEYYNLPH